MSAVLVFQNLSGWGLATRAFADETIDGSDEIVEIIDAPQLTDAQLAEQAALAAEAEAWAAEQAELARQAEEAAAQAAAEQAAAEAAEAEAHAAEQAAMEAAAAEALVAEQAASEEAVRIAAEEQAAAEAAAQAEVEARAAGQAAADEAARQAAEQQATAEAPAQAESEQPATDQPAADADQPADAADDADDAAVENADTAENADATAEEAAHPEEAPAEEATFVPEPNTLATFRVTSGSVEVTATLTDPAALPAGVRLVVTPVEAWTAGYNYDAYMAALNNSSAPDKEYTAQNTLLYDIAFIADKLDDQGNPTGQTYECEVAAGSVNVSMRFLAGELSDDLNVIDDADVEVTHLVLDADVLDAVDSTAEATQISAYDITPIAMDADVNVGASETVQFETTTFSVFAISYTVDFTYDGYEYSIAGASSITLVDLFAALGIDADASNVVDVTFSDPSLVAVSNIDGTWLLTSLQPFATNETLTVKLANGVTYVIDVTDAVNGNMQDFITDVYVDHSVIDEENADKPIAHNDSGEIIAYTNYVFSIWLAENDQDQFAESMSMPVPDGLELVDIRGKINIGVRYGGVDYLVSDNEWYTEDGILYLELNTNDPNYEYLRSADNASINLWFKGSASGEYNPIMWNDRIRTNISDQQPEVIVEKEAEYKQGSGTIQYTITITSKGDNKNVVVTDTIKGTAITLDKGSFESWSDREFHVDGIDVVYDNNDHEYLVDTNDNGNTTWKTIISKMEDNEKIYINYSCLVDKGLFDNAGAGKEETLNVVEVESDQDLDPDTDEAFIRVPSTRVQKSSDLSDSTVAWTIEVTGYLNGHIIRDELMRNRDAMTYTGEGITITYTANQGTVPDTHIETWTDLGVNETSTSWSYVLPELDDQAYYDENGTYHDVTCSISFTTAVDTTGFKDDFVVSNNATDQTSGESDNAEETIGVDKFDVSKRSLGHDDEGISWEIVLNVPAEGATSAIVRDTFPSVSTDNINYIIEGQIGEITIVGLEPNEMWTIQGIEHSWIAGLYIGSAISFSYFENDGTHHDGLVGTGHPRQIKITLKTRLDPNWITTALDAAKSDPYAHTNSVTFTIDDNEKKTEATERVVPNAQVNKMHFNELNSEDENNVVRDGNDVFVRYRIVTSLPDGDYDIEDLFDPQYLRFVSGILTRNVLSQPIETLKEEYQNSSWLPFVYPTVEDYIAANTSSSDFDFNPILHSSMEIDPGEWSSLSSEFIMPEVTCENGVTHFHVDSANLHGLLENGARSLVLDYWMQVDEGAATHESARIAEPVIIRNTAVYYNESDEDELTVKTSALEKSGEVVGNVINYTIIVNRDAEDLSAGDTLTLTDEFTDNYSIYYDSIVVTDITTNEIVDIVYDVTAQTMVLIVPDNRALRVTYSGFVNKKDELTVENTVRLLGFEEKEISEVTSGGSGKASVLTIVLMKYSANNINERVPGATYTLFEMTDNANQDDIGTWTLLKDFVTGADGEVTIVGNAEDDGWVLHEGVRYALKESIAPAGYQLDPTVYYFTISTDGDSNYNDYVFLSGEQLKIRESRSERVNYIYDGITITKTDKDTEAKLPGAEFTLYADRSCTEEIATYVTGEDGTVTISVDPAVDRTLQAYLPDPKTTATYFLMETKAPHGYFLDETVHELAIVSTQEGAWNDGHDEYNSEITYQVQFDRSSDDVVLTNDQIKARIAKLDSATDEYLTGAVLQVLDPDQKQVDKWVTGEEKDADGNPVTMHVVTGLDVGVEYTLHEDQAPKGYEVAEDIVFTVTSEGGIETEADVQTIDGMSVIVMKDNAKPSTLIITKTVEGVDDDSIDELGREIFFTVEHPEDSTFLDAQGNVSDDAVEISLNEFTKDENGVYTLEFKDVAPGAYEVVEIREKEPVGYIYIGSQSLDRDKAELKKGESGTVALKNVYKQIKVTKVDTNGKDLVGATLQVLNAKGEPVDTWITGKVEGSTSELIDALDETGTPIVTHVVTGLKIGEEYTLHEVAAPKGYTVAKDAHFTIGTDGNVKWEGSTSKDGVLLVEDHAAPTFQKKIKDVNDTEGPASLSSWQDSADYDIDDAVPFQLTATLADNVTDYRTYKITFTDQMEKSLDFAGIESVKVGNTTLGEDDYKLQTSEDKHSFTLTITWGDGKAQIADKGLNGADVEVLFWATLNDKANIGAKGNVNGAKLTYSSNPNVATDADGNETPSNETGDTDWDYVIVFTYQLVAGKENLKGNALAGATFMLEKLVMDENGKQEYVKLPDPIENEAHTTFTFKGIDDGKYKLTELNPPPGYLVAAPVEITVTADHEAIWRAASDGKESVYNFDAAPEGLGRLNVLKELTATKGEGAVDEPKVEKDSGTITDAIIDGMTLAVISKVDENGNVVEGAKLQIVDEDGEIIDQWTSVNEAHGVEGKLVVGKTYILQEVQPPLGYEAAEDIEFTIDEDGNIVTKGKLTDTGALLMSDAMVGPQIEKYVNKDVHADLDAFDEVFTYDVLAYATADADTLTITDELVKGLEFVSAEKDVTVVDLGETVDHKAGSDGGVAKDASKDAASIKFDAQMSPKTLTVAIQNVKDQNLRGHWVKVTFQAKLDNTVVADLEDYTNNLEQVKNNATQNEIDEVESTAYPTHEGVPNKASYTIQTNNTSKYTCDSNTVTVTPGTTELSVEKVWRSADGKELGWPKDATVTVALAVDGKVAEGATTLKLDAEHPSGTFEDLPVYADRTYSVVEASVEGVPDSFIASVAANADDEEASYDFTITNTQTIVKVSKVDIVSGDELQGATIQILDKDGTVVAEWESAAEPHEVTGLKTGEEYTLRETVAPEGYLIAADTTFILNEDGTVDAKQTTAAVSEDGVLLVEDALPSIKVSKVDLTNDKELEGAKIQILDEEGTIVEEWVSTTEPYEVAGLKTGKTYTLHETVAPEGYRLASDTTFSIDENGKVQSTGSVISDGVLLIKDALDSVPTFEKKVMDVNDTTGKESIWQDSADYDIGDAVPFRLTATLAQNVTDYRTYTITFTDKMEESLTFDEKSVTVNVGGKEAENYELVPIDDHNFKLTLTWTGEDGKAIADDDLNGAEVEVLFRATLNESANIGPKGNINGAKLTYSSNPSVTKDADGNEVPSNETEDAEWDYVIVFTYQLNVTKVDKNEEPIDGAEFKLEKKLADGTNELVATVTAKDAKDGTFSFAGLDDGTYVLTETKAPAGYVLLDDPIEIVVEAKHVESWAVSSATFDITEKLVDKDGNTRGDVLTDLTGTKDSGEVELTVTKDFATISGSVENTKTSVSVSKVDATSSEELEGATIQILKVDEDGTETVVEEWTSGKDRNDDGSIAPHVVEGLETGVEYTLRETVAPEGYKFTTDTTFVLNEDGTVDSEESTASVSKDGVLLVEDTLASVPKFEKKVMDANDSTGEKSGWQDSADYDIGDEVPFRLTATLADNVTDYRTYKVTFTDQMEESLDFIKIDSVKVGSQELAADDYDLVKTDDQNFSLTITWTGEDGAKIADADLNGATVEVLFSATLNEKANLGAQGNVNAARLTYSNNPNVIKQPDGTEKPSDETGTTDWDYVIVFTYGLDLSKVDQAGDALKGAKFQLQKLVKGADGAADDYADVALNVSDDGTTFTATGIDDGTYVLTETAAPAGYLPIDPITFEVSASHDGDWEVTSGAYGTAELKGRTAVLTGLTGHAIEGEVELAVDEDAAVALASLAGDIANRVTEVRVTKVDANGGQELEGAHIQIIKVADDGTETVVEEWTSGDDRDDEGNVVIQHVVEGLEVGVEYTLRETVAPDGYRFTADTTFSIDEEGKVSSTGTVTTDDDGNQIMLVEDDLASVPDFEKKVKDANDSTGETSGWQDSADYDIGDAVPFQLAATLANNVTDYRTYKVTFTDQMEKSLTFAGIESVKIQKAGSEDWEPVEGYELDKVDAQNFVLTLTWTGEDGAKIADTGLDGAKVEVLFSATLNEDAVLGAQGNVNKAKLAYSNNPNLVDDGKGGTKPSDETGTTDWDSVIVFTYKVEISKTDTAGKALEGAEFKLEKAVVDEDGAEALEEVTRITVDADGTTFTFTGLDDGDYVLTETKAPEGHTAVQPVRFTVAAEHNAECDPATSGRTEVLTSLTGDVTSGAIALAVDEDGKALAADDALEGLTGAVKNATAPTFEKKVMDANDSIGEKSGWQDSADYDIGDEVPFRLSATLADNVTDYRTYTITFTDQMEASLDFAGVDKVTVGGIEVEDYELVEGDAQNFMLTLTWTGEDGAQIADASLNGATVEVYFSATLNEAANLGAQGNVNAAKLTYSNNPNVVTDVEGNEAPSDGTDDTEWDYVIVFTYQVELTKVDENGDALAGAEFTLQKLVKGEDGAEDEYTDVALAVSDDGTTFTATGIDDGEYLLTETGVPEGYLAIKPVKITVDAGHATVWDYTSKAYDVEPSGGAARTTILTSLTGDAAGGAIDLTVDPQAKESLATLVGDVKDATQPTFEKKVMDANDSTGQASGWQDSADYDIGDAVSFKLSARLASNVGDYYTYHVTFTDQMEESLTFGEITSIQIDGVQVDRAAFAGYDLMAGEHDFALTLTWGDGEQQIAATDLGSSLDQAVVDVYFTATLNETANLGAEGNVNGAKLTYSTNPYLVDDGTGTGGTKPDDSTEDTEWDYVIVFTYGLDLSKVDQDGVALEGAQFKLQKLVKGTDGTADAYVDVALAISEDGATFTATGVDDGTYILTETAAPAGYLPIDPVTFEVKAEHDGAWNVLTEGYTAELDGRTAILTALTGKAAKGEIDLAASEADEVALATLAGDVANQVTKVTVTKVDVADGEELEGAHIQIIEMADDGTETVVEEWTSGDDRDEDGDGVVPHVVEGLEVGVEYVLRETVAPEGYTVTSDTTFSIDEEGKVTSTGTTTTDEDGNEVLLVEDAKTSVRISKVDVTSGEELEGATIQIIDSKGEVVEEWVSTDEAHVVEGLKTGEEYTLRETVAPEGYTVAAETTFTIDEDGTVTSTGTTTTDEDGNEVMLVEDYTAPTFEKKIMDADDTAGTKSGWQDSADYDMGDAVPYLLRATLAGNVHDYYQYQITFADRLEESLDFSGIEKVTVNGVEVKDYQLDKVDDHIFEVTLIWGDGKTKIASTSLDGAEVCVYFSAVLNERATLGVPGNVNGAALLYSSNPNLVDDGNGGKEPSGETGVTDWDYVIAFTYALGIDKVDADGKPLAGAQFKLQKVTPAGNVDAGLVVSKDGTSFKATGIDDGTYILTETKAPEGYVLADPVTIVVTAQHAAVWETSSSYYTAGGSSRTTVLTALTGDEKTGTIKLAAEKDLTGLTGDVANAKTSVKISKVDVADGEELPGATIQILGEDGNVVEEWVSTDQPHEVTGLKTGVTYTLRETVAPEGYDITTDTTFVIDEHGKVTSTGSVTEEGILLVEDARKQEQPKPEQPKPEAQKPVEKIAKTGDATDPMAPVGAGLAGGAALAAGAWLLGRRRREGLDA